MMQIGEAFIGSGPNAAHINTVLGDRSGPVGVAWATALATPSTGHAAFLAVAQPGVAVVPPTVFVNKAAIEGERHGTMTWGPAQAGVANGVARALEDGVIDASHVTNLILIAAVWVNPAADDTEAVFENNAEATLFALRAGRDGLPTLAEALAAGNDPWNPFFRAP